jgi:hypothetical protein
MPDMKLITTALRDQVVNAIQRFVRMAFEFREDFGINSLTTGVTLTLSVAYSLKICSHCI